MVKKGELIIMETGEVLLIDPSTKKIRNPENFVLGEFSKDKEIPVGKSMTVPDESFTIEEILEKFTRGVLPDVMQNAEYDEIVDFDGFESEKPVDITEVEAQLTEVKERLSKSTSVSEKAKMSENTTTKEEEKSEDKPEAKKVDLEKP